MKTRFENLESRILYGCVTICNQKWQENSLSPTDDRNRAFTFSHLIFWLRIAGNQHPVDRIAQLHIMESCNTSSETFLLLQGRHVWGILRNCSGQYDCFIQWNDLVILGANINIFIETLFYCFFNN